MFAAGLAQRQARSAPVQILIRDGRHVDDSLDPIWGKMHDEGLAGMTALGCLLHVALAGKMLDRYWEVPDASFAERVRAVYAWSPLPAPLTGVVLALPLVVVVIAAVVARAAPRSPLLSRH